MTVGGTCETFSHRTFLVYVTFPLKTVTSCCSLQKSTGLFAQSLATSGKGLTSLRSKSLNDTSKYYFSSG